MALTQEEVWAAADKLVAAGIPPSLRLIRESLGTGSFATLGPLLVAWRQRQAIHASPIAEPVPAAVEQRMEQACMEVWRAAMAAADARLDAERYALSEARAASEAAASESAEVADQLSAELEQARNRMAEQDRLLADATSRANELQLRLAAETARAEEVSRQLQKAEQALALARQDTDEASRKAADAQGRLEELVQLRDMLRDSARRDRR